ncbi:hypothetical protein [Streptomyces sp. NPDC056987]|uniref:hypothetical protein n=1 Tax=Streptomyces sp. NPDC056987 TaxID=3345988 RepID=UPI003636E05B
MITLILAHSDNRPEPGSVVLKELRDRSRDLGAACQLVACFAEVLVHHQGQEKLVRWAHGAEQRRRPDLRGFTAGLGKDWDAVMVGLTSRTVRQLKIRKTGLRKSRQSHGSTAGRRARPS